MKALYLAGNTTIKYIPASKLVSPFWRIKNALTWKYLWGLITTQMAKWLTKLTGIPALLGQLELTKVYAGDGHREYYGVVSRRVVTTTGVGFLTDAWRNSVELENMKYHGCGTGTTAEAVGDSALETESTTILNPDSTRATGTLAGSGTTFTSVGTLSFDGAGNITEHGLLSQAATGGGVLFDRSVFTAVPVQSGDSIQFTYTVTLTAGS